MAKDPAFLFYSGDFLTGTQFFTDEQVGLYLRLLMAQHQHGNLTEKQVKIICKSHDSEVMAKFRIDKDNKYYNKRLETEIIKRKLFTLSRSNNKKGKLKYVDITLSDTKKTRKSYDNHMDNVIKDIDDNELKEKFSQLFQTDKWIKKKASSLVAAVAKSKQYNNSFMIELIDKAIIGEYQGLYFSNTDEDYKKYLKFKSDLGQKQTKETVYSTPDTKF